MEENLATILRDALKEQSREWHRTTEEGTKAIIEASRIQAEASRAHAEASSVLAADARASQELTRQWMEILMRHEKRSEELHLQALARYDQSAALIGRGMADVHAMIGQVNEILHDRNHMAELKKNILTEKKEKIQEERTWWEKVYVPILTVLGAALISALAALLSALSRK